MRFMSKYFIFLLVFLSILTNWQTTEAQAPTIRAVLFFSEDCSHCHTVIEEVLPQLKEKYQDQIDIVGINITPDQGYALYESAVTTYSIPNDRIGVPTMIIGDVVLVGADEIANQLPVIIDQGVSSGGIEWPDFPGLRQALAVQPAIQANPPTISTDTNIIQRIIETFSLDPLANTLSVIILIFMIISVLFIAYYFIRELDHKLFHWPAWVIPLLVIIGLVVAIYLSYIEVTGRIAVCGPVGNCNSVQQSKYAHLFGIIPIGVMGVVGYIAIILAWVSQIYGPISTRGISALAIWGMSLFGTLFSIYLTFLEPFVIGATCAWCLTSAIVMTMIFWVSTGPARQAWNWGEEDLEDVEDIMMDQIQP